ncbi:MAG: chemotaxis protein CheB [Isosphaeraceae bacterium]|nr:chemotaxis protein CheB [Isosphaeraceae bacterium]
MHGRDIIVVGASAGGVEALTGLICRLPAELPAAVFVVLHIPAHSTSLLPAILSRKGRLPAAHAIDGEAITHGRIYIAPPDAHLLLRRGQVRLSRGPRENGHRPAVDPLFRTAGVTSGRRVVGVVLSGALDDGTAGLMAIKRRGGVAIVQDPEEALYGGMIRNALENVDVDQVLPVAEIAPALVRLAREPVEEEGEDSVPDEMQREAEMATLELGELQDPQRPGTPSGFACPECGGVLWELREGELIRFRCRVGHAWTANSLLAEQSEALESALWMALRALEERAALSERLAERLRGRGHSLSAEKFAQQEDESRRMAEVLRQVLLSMQPASDEVGSEAAGASAETATGASAETATGESAETAAGERGASDG